MVSRFRISQVGESGGEGQIYCFPGASSKAAVTGKACCINFPGYQNKSGAIGSKRTVSLFATLRQLTFQVQKGCSFALLLASMKNRQAAQTLCHAVRGQNIA